MAQANGGDAGVMATNARSATKWRDQTIVTLIEKLARERELQPEECSLMERTVRRLKPKRSIWRWHPREDEEIIALIKRRKRLGRPKPFQRNDEVRLLAAKFGRSYMAVHRRMERLRKREKCSDAGNRRKG